MVRICKDPEAVLAARAEYKISKGKYRRLVCIVRKDFSKKDTIRYSKEMDK